MSHYPNKLLGVETRGERTPCGSDGGSHYPIKLSGVETHELLYKQQKPESWSHYPIKLSGVETDEECFWRVITAHCPITRSSFQALRPTPFSLNAFEHLEGGFRAPLF